MGPSDLNPFVTERPVPAEDIIDREQELAQLIAYAEAGHAARLTAPRRYGKTTLAKRTLDLVERAGLHAVYVDLYGVVTLEQVAMRIEDAYDKRLRGEVQRRVRSILRTMRGGVSAGIPGVASVQVASAGVADPLIERRLQATLDLPARTFERDGIRTVIVLDEFQDLLVADVGADALLRARIQHHGDCASYLFAGSHPTMMAALFEAKDRPLYGYARPLTLRPLPDEALAEHIADRFARTGRDIGEALEPLLDIAGGHPQRAMLLAHHLWQATPRGTSADEQTWELAFAATLSELHEAFQRGWDAHSANERRVLEIIATRLPLTARTTLSTHQIGKQSALTARESLVAAGDLAEPGHGGARFTDPLYAAWIGHGRRSPDTPAGEPRA